MDNVGEKPETDDDQAAEKVARRKISGNLPYLSTPGVLKQVLEKLPASEKPSVFNVDFLETVLGVSKGSARPIVPIFRSVGLVDSSGVPTERYSSFRTEGGRADAALGALKTGFSEIFKRNVFAHRASEAQLTDIIVGVTGLSKSDRLVGYIRSTFGCFQTYARSANEAPDQPTRPPPPDISEEPADNTAGLQNSQRGSVGLIYNINVVLPETTDIEVYNTIFRSLKANML